MKPEQALLLCMGTVGELSSSLQTLIESSFGRQLQVEPMPIQLGEVADFTSEFDKTIQRLNPVLIFLVAQTEILEQAGKVLQAIRTAAPDIPMTAVLDKCEPDDVFALIKKGAADFITSPLKASEVLPRTWRLLRRPNHSQDLTDTLRTELGLRQLIGQSPDFLMQVQQIPQIASCGSNVMLCGETGTGKELYARAIHYCSQRAGGPFVPVNCGAIPVDLVENELFGHQRGAFTGAFTWQPGLIEEAGGGTLFLDEIDCLPTLAQVKLLRLLQEKEYRPLGSTKMRRADVRIISASNLNLEEAVANGKLRQDLYYRLNIISLTLSPLRERREDIPLLARHFASKYSTEFHKDTLGFSVDALNSLMTRRWPGNVRELEHVIERAIVMCDGPTIHASDLAPELSSQPRAGQESLREAKAREIARFEKNYVQALLCASGGNITKAALVAQKNRRAFWQLIQKHQIDVSRYRL